MKISVFGLGYVGAVCVACFSKNGNEVIGVDIDPTKVEQFTQGKSPVVEPGLEDLIGGAVKDGRIRTTTSAADAVARSEISLVCVGTPSRTNGNLDVTAVESVCHEIGAAIEEKSERHLVVIRSTVLPGTMTDVVIPALEQASGKKAGTDFGLAHNPEFLREGTAIEDFHNPPKTVIGAFRSGVGTSHGRTLRRDHGASDHHVSGGQRNGQVHRQCLACAESVFRKRDWQPCAKLRA